MRTLLSDWFHQLPPPVIHLVRRLRRLPPPGPVVHTAASWRKECRNKLRKIGGSISLMGKEQCKITWLAKAGEKTKLTASLRINPSSDLDVFCQVWTEQQYRAVAEYMQPWISTNNELHIIDAGANVGFTTLYFKAQFPNAHIISLEPEDSNYLQLTNNVMANNLHGVTMLKAGLWKSKAFLEIGRDMADQREWSFYVKEAAQPTELQGYDVQHLMKNAHWDHIDLLKIDIEGAERYLFADDETASQTLRSARFLAIEIHDDFQIRPQIYSCLEKYGFEYFDNGELTIGRNKNLVK